MKKSTFRVVTRGADGSLRIRDYDTKETLLRLHTQIGIDDSSTDLALRGLPVFRGLIGPMRKTAPWSGTSLPKFLKRSPKNGHGQASPTQPTAALLPADSNRRRQPSQLRSRTGGPGQPRRQLTPRFVTLARFANRVSSRERMHALGIA